MSKPTAKDDLMKTDKKLTLSKETLRTLDEKDLAQVVGGAGSGSHQPPNGGPNSCPNTKAPGCH
jgi:bacteriocin-like protein